MQRQTGVTIEFSDIMDACWHEWARIQSLAIKSTHLPTEPTNSPTKMEANK